VYTKNVYVATMAICIFHCVILVGLPTGILFLCDAVKRHHHLVVKQGIVMVISMVIVLPFIAATAYV
jgi:glucose uptake protein GlcU